MSSLDGECLQGYSIMLCVISLTGVGVQFAELLLLLFSVLSVAVMIERGVTLRRVRALEERDYALLRRALDQSEAAGLSALAMGTAPCALALQQGLVQATTSEMRRREAIGQGITVQAARLQQRLGALGTIASTAPYIGLFGTVLGILQAFHEIAVSGKTGASVVAGGISEALLTTALGLGVAIPAVIAYNTLSGKINDLTLAIETHTLTLAACLPLLPEAEAERQR